MAEEFASAMVPGEWSAVAGHEATKERLQTLLREGRVPHALLFSGPRGIGKRMLAAATAAALLCKSPKDGLACGVCESCRALAAGTHPDFYVVLPETLEEPPGDTVFFLVTGARQSLLPTIVSRCTGVRFAPLNDEAMAQVLTEHGVSEELLKPLIALSEGSAGRALRLFEEDALSLREDAMTTLERLPQMTPEDVFSLGEQLGAMDRERLSEWLRYFRMLLRDLLAIYGGSGALLNADLEERLFALSGKISERKAFLAAREAAEAARRIETSNAVTRLAIESFLLRTGK